MCFYWIRDRVHQGQFLVYWKKGSLNKADYFTKHHPTSHHRAIHSSYLHSTSNCSKNYFECLQDTENAVIPVTQAASPVTGAATFAANVTKQLAVRVC
jgi:CCR4-NOT transcriptional regulation complex NOT5 subunit